VSEPDLIYTSPYSFSYRQRIVLAVAPPAIAITLKLLGLTYRVENRNKVLYDEVVDRHGHVILGFWHETLAMAAWWYRGTRAHTLTSYSFDGELAARMLPFVNIYAVRGSSSRGGSEALHQLALATERVEIVGFTFDGPKGPRRVAKAGGSILSARTGIPVLPTVLAAAPAWRLKSWDRMCIAKPFGRLVCLYAPAVPSPVDESPEVIEEHRLEVERRLNEAHAELESELGIVGSVLDPSD
jgi:lysophospholipid acyltransferase (LPLAT)-like uncharacterized protein